MRKINKIFFIIVPLLIFILIELYVRVIINYPLPAKSHPDGMLIYNGFAGYSLKPGFLGYFPNSNISISINSNGLRDYEHSYKRKDNETYRIMMLGDTALFGSGIEINSTIPKLLEKKFNDGGYNTEIINGAVNGYQIESLHNFYFHELNKYEVDLVIINIALNDIIPDNLTKIKDSFLIENDNGYSVPDKPFRRTVKKICHSCVYAYSYYTGLKLGRGFGEKGYRQYILDFWSNDERYSSFKASIVNISGDLKRRDIEVIWVVSPYLWQLDDYESKSQPQKYLNTLADEQHITLVDLSNDFLKGEYNDYYLYGSGGMVENAKSTRIVVSRLYNEILFNNLLQNNKTKNYNELLY